MERELAPYIQALLQVGCRHFPVRVHPEAEDIGETKENLLGSTMLERHHFGATITVQTCGQSVGSFRICDKCGVLITRELGLDLQIIFKRVKRDTLKPPGNLFPEVRVE